MSNHKNIVLVFEKERNLFLSRGRTSWPSMMLLMVFLLRVICCDTDADGDGGGDGDRVAYGLYFFNIVVLLLFWIFKYSNKIKLFEVNAQIDSEINRPPLNPNALKHKKSPTTPIIPKTIATKPSNSS
jgi:hypothetical protein